MKCMNTETLCRLMGSRPRDIDPGGVHVVQNVVRMPNVNKLMVQTKRLGHDRPVLEYVEVSHAEYDGLPHAEDVLRAFPEVEVEP